MQRLIVKRLACFGRKGTRTISGAALCCSSASSRLYDLCVPVRSGISATAHLWRIEALRRYRLAVSLLNWFVACSGAPSHCLSPKAQTARLWLAMMRLQQGFAGGGMGLDVRFGSEADIQPLRRDVPFTPESGHSHTPGANAVLARQAKAT
jgi:hypothetical protein